MIKDFQTEQNELLEYLVANLVYPKFAIAETNFGQKMVLELYITTTCNKNCEYCYLQKNKDKLYPQELNKPEIIEKNCQLLLDYYIEQKLKIHSVDLFSGEIIGSNLWFNIIEMLRNASNRGLNIDAILVPTNGYFLVDDNIRLKIENLIKDLRKDGIRLIFSFSDDGGVLDETNRPLTNGQTQNKEKFYKEAKRFAKKYEHGFHPMVNAHGIEKWVDNFKWWKEYVKDLPPFDILSNVMFLEVRNDEWTDDKIEEYLKFLKVLTETIPESYPQMSKEDLLNILCHKNATVVQTSTGPKKLPFANNYQPFGLLAGERISCAITHSFCVRLGDLAICPCHRLAYDHLLYGKYKINDNKITGIEANNIQLFLSNLVTGYNGFLKCDSCPINNYCLKGCRGAQYEVFKDVCCPIPSVCNFMKVKMMYYFLNILYLAEKYNLSEKVKHYTTTFTQVLHELKKEDEEFYNKWKNIIYQYLLEI